MTSAMMMTGVLLVPLTAARRAWLVFVLAVVLSAADVERRRRITEPTPIVMTMDRPPVRPMRARPYRAHYRHIGAPRR